MLVEYTTHTRIDLESNLGEVLITHNIVVCSYASLIYGLLIFLASRQVVSLHLLDFERLARIKIRMEEVSCGECNFFEGEKAHLEGHFVRNLLHPGVHSSLVANYFEVNC